LRLPRRDNPLNDAIEALDEKYTEAQRRAKTDIEIVPIAWSLLDRDELKFIDEQVGKSIDRRYFMENYYVIRDEAGRLRTLYPFWDHQEMIYEVIEEEWNGKGCVRLIILKPRQAGSTAWNGALIYHGTIFQPNSFSLVMAQRSDISLEIYTRIMVEAHPHIPWWLRAETSSKQQGLRVLFQRSDDVRRDTDPGLGSTILISDAQKSAGIAIGRTIRNLLGCLTARNYVLTPDNYLLSIAGVQIGSEVLIPGGGLGKVTAFSARPAGEIFDGAEHGYRITTWCNPAFPLEGTGNHRVLCCRLMDRFKLERRAQNASDIGHRRENKIVIEYDLKEFSQITKDDFMVIPVTPITCNGVLPEGGISPYRPQGGGSVNSWFPPDPSREFGFAIGLYLAEGSISNSVTITLDQDERALADRFAAAVGIQYGKVNGNAGTRTLHFHFYNAAFRIWLKENLGRKDGKRVPRWAWSLGREFLLGIVEGMILGDGHLSSVDHGSSFCSTRAHLAVGIREAVCSLGLGYGGILTREAGFFYGRNCQRIYHVRFGRLTDNAIRSEFGWEKASRESKRDVAHYYYSADKSEIYIRVHEIERVELGMVYDIEVDTPEHVYMLPGAVTHNSEVSRWPDAQVWTSDIKPSLNAPDMLGILESTAFGRNGLYWNMWNAAEKGKSIWRALFIPVYKVTKYYLPVYKRENFALTPEEKKIRRAVLEREQFKIPIGFFKWRRQDIIETINSTGSDETHKEAYPITSKEAFLSSGDCAFPKKELDRQSRENVRDPKWVGEIEYVSMDDPPILHLHTPIDDEIADKPDKFNRFWVWEEPIADAEYYLGADVASGEARDFSDAYIMRLGWGSEPDVQVAEWHGKMNASHYARVLAAIGHWYNDCEVAVEYTQSGITTGDELRWVIDYPNLYRWKRLDVITNVNTQHIHWVTNQRTRDDAINRYCEALLDHSIVERNHHGIEELRDFARYEGEGKAQGIDNNDDMCMARLICKGASHQSNKRQEMTESRAMGTGQSSATVAGLMPKAPQVFSLVDQYGRTIQQVSSIDAGNKLISECEKKYKIKLADTWRIIPVTVMKCNTPWSPAYDDPNSAQAQLMAGGLEPRHQTLEIIQIYRDMLNHQQHTGVIDIED
jgi:hypothetical protein